MRFKKTIFLLFTLGILYGITNTALQTYRLFKKNQEIAALKEQKKQWQEKNQILGKKIKSLDGNHPDKDFLEELAREKLGYNYSDDIHLKDH